MAPENEMLEVFGSGVRACLPPLGTPEGLGEGGHSH